jgi:hypothetical protein
MPALPLDLTPAEVAAPALVVTLIALRWYYGSTLLSLRFLGFWGVARRLFMPLVDRVAKRVAGVSAENRAVPEEHVGDFSRSPKRLATTIQQASGRRFEVSVLSGLKTDWDGNTEVASIVGYHGAKPFPGAPDWLRAQQVHVFMFRIEGGTRVAAHEEANSWRPDLWRDHLRKGDSFDAAAGVAEVRSWVDR